jgi:hypothetical protein
VTNVGVGLHDVVADMDEGAFAVPMETNLFEMLHGMRSNIPAVKGRASP